MKLAQLTFAAVALSLSVAQAAITPIGPCPDTAQGNPTDELNHLLSFLAVTDPQPNGGFIKYAQGASVEDSGDLLLPAGDSITVPGISISGSDLHFDDSDPFYFLVKAGTSQCMYYYDGVGSVDLVDPIVNPRNGNPREYSHATFFGITVQTPDPSVPAVPDASSTLALMGLALAGVAGLRRSLKVRE